MNLEVCVVGYRYTWRVGTVLHELVTPLCQRLHDRRVEDVVTLAGERQDREDACCVATPHPGAEPQYPKPQGLHAVSSLEKNNSIVFFSSMQYKIQIPLTH